MVIVVQLQGSAQGSKDECVGGFAFGGGKQTLRGVCALLRSDGRTCLPSGATPLYPMGVPVTAVLTCLSLVGAPVVPVPVLRLQLGLDFNKTRTESVVVGMETFNSTKKRGGVTVKKVRS